MTDPKRRNARLTESTLKPSNASESPPHTGETTIRAIRTPAPRPAEAEAVEIRPVRRPAGSPRPTTSLEALSATAAAGRHNHTAPVERLLSEGHPSEPLRVPPARAPRGSAPRADTTSSVQQAASEPSHTPVAESPAPRSGWLNHALNDWLQEPTAPSEPAPAARSEAVQPAAARPATQRPPTDQPPANPSTTDRPTALTPASVMQVIRADAPSPAPAIEPEDLPLTLQDALASDRLPDLPIELLEQLWEQEQVDLGESEEIAPATSEPSTPQPQFIPATQQRSGVGTAAGPLPSPYRPLSAMPAEAHAIVPTLQPMFPGVSPFLARFLPFSAPLQMGLNARFCDLHAFLKYLHDLSWYGYLHVAMGDLSTSALVYEGRVVAAAAVNATGEQALGELLSLYEQGATMATYPLPPTYAHVLSGVGSRAWKFDLTEDFTGLYASPDGALFYSRGEVVATMPAGLPYEGAFPAPLRPQTLMLPRSFAGWAHRPYVLTLRGRDANNPITGVYREFRTKYGEAGAQFIRALGQEQTPAEYAVRTDVALHDLEAMLQEFTQGGYLKEQGA